MDIHESLGPNPMIGRRIGVYRLDEEVGRGGMGAVYRAARVDGEFDQTVAIKLIKRGMDTDLILKRFRNERQILATLSHPNIAFFIGGGTTRDGLPYFVMEYVDGLPLYAYCDQNQLSIKDRLFIFRQICWAVSAAHTIKVIHRDLKPSNVLVKDGKPKLLDFGIAKVLDPELMATEIDPTATERRVMTPEYASPEQIGGETIGAASDIYSLGVILYELLTGHRPYILKRQLPDETSRTIREEQPLSPSACLTQDESLLRTPAGGKAELETVLRVRRATLDDLKRDLSGELDKVVLKALRKSPADRYGSARELADDITNYLEGRPVNAEFFVSVANLPRPRQTNRVSVAVLPLSNLRAVTEDSGDEFLGIGLADSLIARLSAVSRLVVMPTSSVLGFAGQDAIEAGRTLGVDYILDGNIRKFGDRVRVSVQLLNVADSAMRWAQAFDENEVDLLELEDKISDQVASSLLPQLTTEERGRLDRRRTNVPKAYKAYLRGRYFVNRFTGEHLPLAVEAFNEASKLDPNYPYPIIGLADVFIWSAVFGEMPSKVALDKATALLKRAIEIDDSIGEAYAALAFCIFLSDWNWTAAEEIVRKAIDLSPNHAFAHECLSNFYVAQGRFDDGVSEILRAEELDPLSPRAKLMSAWTLYHARRYDEAVEKAEAANRMQPEFPQGLLHLGNILTAMGRLDEAIEVLQASARLWPTSAMPRYMLAFALAAAGKNNEAAEVTTQVESRPDQKAYFVAMCYTAIGDVDKAFQWFERAVEDRNEWMVWFGVEPKLDPLRTDPRYLELLRKVNNPMAVETDSEEIRLDTDQRIRSIAVLPFKVIGNRPEESGEQFLSVGLADAVTMRLSNVGRFLVRPTSSVLSYGKDDVDPFAAGKDLGVTFVVDGIIRHIEDKIRVTVQLLDVDDSRIFWAASFDEKFTDVLELEDLISERVTHSLLPKITGDEERKLAKRGTQNAAAHEAYLQGRYFWNQFIPEALQKASEYFRRAIELDPAYALAYVGIADYYSWAAIYGMIPPAESFGEVYKAAQRAIEIDDGLADAHAALGLYYSNSQEWEQAEREHRRAIKLNPNFPLSHEWLSAILVGTGRFEEGKQEILTAELLDPLSLRPKVLTAWTIYQARDFVASLEKANELISLDPKFWQGYLQAANSLLEMGDITRALDCARQGADLGGESPLPTYMLCFALAADGDQASSIALAEKLFERSRRQYVPPYFTGMSFIAAGDIERAFAEFHKAQAEKTAWMVWWGTEPKLDRVKNDERYWKILEATKNPIINALNR
jgi:serine/threonine protein kinase/tetratricopeptide (TPR) repeat protein